MTPEQEGANQSSRSPVPRLTNTSEPDVRSGSPLRRPSRPGIVPIPCRTRTTAKRPRCQLPTDGPGRRCGRRPGFRGAGEGFGASILASLFDYSDTEEDVKNKGHLGSFVGNPLEYSYDLGLIRPLMKMYELLAQGGSYIGAAAPGGIDYMSWDDARKISPGQVALLNVENALDGQGLYDPSRSVEDTINLALTSMVGAGSYTVLNSLMFGGDALPDRFQSDPAQYLSKKRQEEVFGEGAAKYISGGYDFYYALTVDPLIFVPAGKAIKFSRLRLLDETLKTEDDVRRAQTVLGDQAESVKAKERELIESGDYANMTPEQQADALGLTVGEGLGEAGVLQSSTNLVKSAVGRGEELSGIGQLVAYALVADPRQLVTLSNRTGQDSLWRQINSLNNQQNPDSLFNTMSLAEKYELGTLLAKSSGLGR